MRTLLPNLESLHLAKLNERHRRVPYVSVPIGETVDGEIVSQWVDTKYRRRQLDVLERWALIKEAPDYAPHELIEAMWTVRAEWHNHTLISSLDEEDASSVP